MSPFRYLAASARIANLPSVTYNVWVGSAIALSHAEELSIPWSAINLVFCGLLLCLGGNFLNDWADRDFDGHVDHVGGEGGEAATEPGAEEGSGLGRTPAARQAWLSAGVRAEPRQERSQQGRSHDVDQQHRGRWREDLGAQRTMAGERTESAADGDEGEVTSG